MRIRLTILLFALLFVVPVALAQDEAPPDADAPFAALLALASAVFFATEALKPVLNGLQERYAWTENVHQFVVRAVAAAAALVLIFSIPTEADIIAAFGLTWDVPEWLAKVVTALAVSGGATLLYALRTFFRPSTSAMATVTTSGGTASASVVAPTTRAAA